MNMTAEGVSLVLVTYRDIYQGVAEQREGLGEAYRSRSAIVRVSPTDLKKLGLKDGGRVELKTRSGSVVVAAKADPACPEGIGYMPASLYSNRLASYDPSVSKLPNLKRIESKAVPSEKAITPISDLLARKKVA